MRTVQKDSETSKLELEVKLTSLVRLAASGVRATGIILGGFQTECRLEPQVKAGILAAESAASKAVGEASPS